MNFQEKLAKKEKEIEEGKRFRKELWGICFPIWVVFMMFFISEYTGYSFKMTCIIMFFVISGLFFWTALRAVVKFPEKSPDYL